jgi:phenylalanyl-tRNA synthetase beta chain
MLITTPWLLQYLSSSVAHDALMEAFPRIGLEIEESHKLEGTEGYVADINVLANRPDMLGIIGIAREVAAHFDLKLKYPTFNEAVANAAGPSPLSVQIEAPDLCPRYVGRVMTGVKVARSPKWLQELLTSIGQRPISNVVDITNFVMLEWGQPLHAFDFANVRGKQIIVRRMRPDEKMELLGGKTIDAGKPGQPTLVIADATGPVALAGIMGGKDSETRDSSTEILVEAANFDAPTIRRTRKRIDVSTESSFRFERGVDPNRTLDGAMTRACSLIAELCGGKPVGGAVDAYPSRLEPKVYSLAPSRVSSNLGTDVDAPTIKRSLEKLEMQVTDDLKVTVPTWRIDATDVVVLTEDVARLVGYDNLSMRPTTQAPTPGRRSALDQLRFELSSYLSSVGYLESRTPSLDLPEQVDALQSAASSPQVKLVNPMSREHAVMRTSLLPSLVRVAEGNVRRGTKTVRAYEMDRVYHLPADKKTGAVERWMLGAVAGGMLNEYDWTGRNSAINFYDVKGSVEDVLDVVGARNARFEPTTRAGFTDDACAAIVVEGSTDPLGYVGELDRRAIPMDRIDFKLFGFELDLAALLRTHAGVARYKPLARMPAAPRDLAIVVKKDQPYQPIERTIREQAGPALEWVRLIDVYEGKQVPPGYKSLAFRMLFRAPDRTLTAEEVQTTVDQLVRTLADQFAATLRA